VRADIDHTSGVSLSSVFRFDAFLIKPKLIIGTQEHAGRISVWRKLKSFRRYRTLSRGNFRLDAESGVKRAENYGRARVAAKMTLSISTGSAPQKQIIFNN